MATVSANIDDRGIVRRLRNSLYVFGVALALVAGLAAADASWAFFLIAALPFWGAFSLAYQGLFKT
ncbi:MAG: hypothetical protein HOW73_27670 [Polyangiaceae bacterium]|nr:hypothetical protein [Polyangiaceae bacterium]